MVHTFLVLGQAAANGGALGIPWPLLIGLFAIMYFVLIRPQQKAAKDAAALLTSLKKGDDVVTNSGILGKIVLVADKTITVEISSGVKVRMLKSAVTAKVAVVDEAAKDAAKDEKKIDDAKEVK